MITILLTGWSLAKGWNIRVNVSIVLKLSVILTVRCFCQWNEMIEWDGSSSNLFFVCIRSNRLRNFDVWFFALVFRTNMLVLLTYRNGFWLFANFGKKISGSTTFHLIQNTAHLTTKKKLSFWPLITHLSTKNTPNCLPAFHFLTINYRSVCFVSDHFVPLWQQQNGAQ